jgi:hypothetical protein
MERKILKIVANASDHGGGYCDVLSQNLDQVLRRHHTSDAFAPVHEIEPLIDVVGGTV